MERQKASVTRILALAALALAAVAAGAEIVDMSNKVPTAPMEEFPESRFGSPPIHVSTGVDSGYASRAVREMEGDKTDKTDKILTLQGSERDPAGVAADQRLTANLP